VDSDELMRVLGALERHAVAYVLIGATAMGFHGVIRATEDVDLMVEASAANIGRLRDALRDAYPGDANVDDITDADLLGEYPVVRYYPQGGGDLYFDILTRLGEGASFETIERERREVQGIGVSVATPRALFRLKRDTVRAIDRQDAAALQQRFGLKDEN
jgi:hypothetical protein